MLGYIIAALFMGSVFDARAEARRILPMTAVILFSQLILVYIPGLIHLSLWLRLVNGQEVTLFGVLWLGYIPFIAGDIIKSLIGAAVTKAIR